MKKVHECGHPPSPSTKRDQIIDHIKAALDELAKLPPGSAQSEEDDSEDKQPDVQDTRRSPVLHNTG